MLLDVRRLVHHPRELHDFKGDVSALRVLDGRAVPDGDVTLSKTADTLRLNTPFNICVIYLGFGAGLAVFMFTGYGNPSRLRLRRPR